MKYRTLGKTGLKVSEVGMGTWQLAGKPWGWDAPDEKESMRALYRFIHSNLDTMGFSPWR